MLTRRGGVPDYVKLLDFGLVKAVDSAKKRRMLTAADSITGTPLYMSPESIEDADAADARSDLYSLGGGRLLSAHRPPGVRRGQRAGDHSPPSGHAAGAPVGALGPAKYRRSSSD